jgi:hypothetical protein
VALVSVPQARSMLRSPRPIMLSQMHSSLHSVDSIARCRTMEHDASRLPCFDGAL